MIFSRFLIFTLLLFSYEYAAFAVLSSVEALETRLAMLHLWWLPGMTGCVYLDETILNGATRARLPKGLDACYSTERFMNKPWYYIRRRHPA